MHIYIYIYIYIYITPPNIRKQSGIYLGLIDKNQFYIPFVLVAFLLFMIRLSASVV